MAPATADTCYPSVLSTCPFCSLPPDRLRIEAEHAVVVPDAHPVTEGHTLVVPRQHVTTIYELTVPEQQGTGSWWLKFGSACSRASSGMTSTSASTTASPPGRPNCILQGDETVRFTLQAAKGASDTI